MTFVDSLDKLFYVILGAIVLAIAFAFWKAKRNGKR